MTISEYACEDCGYAYEGCGGLGRLMSRKRGPGRRSAPAKPTASRESVLAALAFACPVDASHAARPWTQEISGWTIPGSIIAACPRCEGRVAVVRAVMELD